MAELGSNKEKDVRLRLRDSYFREGIKLYLDFRGGSAAVRPGSAGRRVKSRRKKDKSNFTHQSSDHSGQLSFGFGTLFPQFTGYQEFNEVSFKMLVGTTGRYLFLPGVISRKIPESESREHRSMLLGQETAELNETAVDHNSFDGPEECRGARSGSFWRVESQTIVARAPFNPGVFQSNINILSGLQKRKGTGTAEAVFLSEVDQKSISNVASTHGS
ncbi:hypothetical protein FB451DRAFT_1176190 [Mycena latifolia]|nr:hypothetical protein FB451DRAFT_1176190 [Mycena latifolia]